MPFGPWPGVAPVVVVNPDILTGGPTLKFCGSMTPAVGSPAFFPDEHPVAGGGSPNSEEYPMPACKVHNLTVKASFNGTGAVCNVTVFKNLVATALTVAIPAGSGAVFQDLVNTISFAAGDRLDVRGDCAALGVVGITLAATVQLQAP